jgi:hypothetical protein
MLVIDLDRSVANTDHRSHLLPDWDSFYLACLEDREIPLALDAIMKLMQPGVGIIYSTGRSEICRAETQDWLLDHGFPSGPVVMGYTKPRDQAYLDLEKIVRMRGRDCRMKAAVMKSTHWQGLDPKTTLVIDDDQGVLEAAHGLGFGTALAPFCWASILKDPDGFLARVMQG